MIEFSFHHAGVSIPDLEEGIDWYRDKLGFEVERQFHIPPANADVAIMRKGDLRFELFCVSGSKPLPEERRTPDSDLRTQGNKHVAFQTEDAERLLSELTEQGVDIALVIRASHGTGFYIRDFAGNLIEFVESA